MSIITKEDQEVIDKIFETFKAILLQIEDIKKRLKNLEKKGKS